jgi:hypothetical protein
MASQSVPGLLLRPATNMSRLTYTLCPNASGYWGKMLHSSMVDPDMERSIGPLDPRPFEVPAEYHHRSCNETISPVKSCLTHTLSPNAFRY